MRPVNMGLQDFNDLDDDAAAEVVRAWADIDSFVDTVLAGRPYPTVDALARVAQTQAATWSDVEVEAALADHPRIGEKHAGSGASAALSRSEQGGVDPDDADVRAQLAEGNRRYEERFDRIFLVRAAGRSAPEILDLLEQRLAHDPQAELRVTAEQLAEIAVLRLRGALS